MAEWSKAGDSSSLLFVGAGSNPAPVTFCFPHVSFVPKGRCRGTYGSIRRMNGKGGEVNSEKKKAVRKKEEKKERTRFPFVLSFFFFSGGGGMPFRGLSRLPRQLTVSPPLPPRPQHTKTQQRRQTVSRSLQFRKKKNTTRTYRGGTHFIEATNGSTCGRKCFCTPHDENMENKTVLTNFNVTRVSHW